MNMAIHFIRIICFNKSIGNQVGMSMKSRESPEYCIQKQENLVSHWNGT